MDGIYPVGTVVRLTGLTARRIRYYEHLGLLSPGRERRRRLYTDAEVARLVEIRDRLLSGQSLRAVCRDFLGPEVKTDALPLLENPDLEDWEEEVVADENDVEAGLLGRLRSPAVRGVQDLHRVQQLMERRARERGALSPGKGHVTSSEEAKE